MTDPHRRRIYGLETEYGITCTSNGQRRLTPDEAARYLFRNVVSWGRSSNVFMGNGGRLYLDVGSHPEFATPECDNPFDAVLYDRAGEQIIANLVAIAEERLANEGINGSIHIVKNNVDSAGNSYGCHENYLLGRNGDESLLESVLIPHLVSRVIYCGSGRIASNSKGFHFQIAQRAEHIWENISSSTTRSRPIINTRDEPHADAEIHRRLHVIVGDTNMSDWAAALKVGSTACVLRMIEDVPSVFKNLTLENPTRAIRDISMDSTLTRRVKLASGREMSALDIQSYLLDLALTHATTGGFDTSEMRALQMWEEALLALTSERTRLIGKVDWITKWHLLDGYCTRHACGLDDSRAQMLDLQYHYIDPQRGLFRVLEQTGRAPLLFTPDAVTHAQDSPPANTRAALRGKFVSEARRLGKDITVDWVHLKVNDQSQKTVVCKDPFLAVDERVDRLIAGLQS